MAAGSSRAKLEDAALAAHARYRGKIQTALKVPVHGLADFATWYTPGVAAVSRAIHADEGQLNRLTNRCNTVAIVTNGTRVLGLGNIGPKAALPVMEGKALLFKYLGGVDAVPLCLDLEEPDAMVAAVRALAPGFGGINLEDIAQPQCFSLLDQLRDKLEIPVWHDDQQGTALVVLAGLRNALAVVGKELATAKLALIGAGAANVAVYHLLVAAGADPQRIVVCDSTGVLNRGRTDIEARQDTYRDKWRICQDSNGQQTTGSAAEAMAGADACIAFSHPGPDVIAPDWVAGMAKDAIVFACANPVPEIWPDAARQAGAAIVATGRSDFDNQVNNALAFPGLFRGILDVGARAISDGMILAAADALAALGRTRGLSAKTILPKLNDLEVPIEVAVATSKQAIADGFAAPPDGHRLRQRAEAMISRAHRGIAAMVQTGAIAPFEV